VFFTGENDCDVGWALLLIVTVAVDGIVRMHEFPALNPVPQLCVRKDPEMLFNVRGADPTFRSARYGSQ
jgi:hypothetical protein